MGHLGKCLIYVLSLYVYGVVMVQHCGQTRVVTFLSGLLDCSYDTLRQRLRELTYASGDKRGDRRQEIVVRHCFAPLLGWVLSQFRGQQQQVVLALDATTLRNRFTILSISVVVGGCAIPVAWHIQEGGNKGSWNRIWRRLIQQLKPAVPRSWSVFALTDSGLYAKPLYRYLTQTCRWNVFMRSDLSQGLFKAHYSRRWRPINQWLSRGMSPCVLRGTCFKSNPITCTLVLLWDAAYQHPCILITNRPPQQVTANVYAIRYWIECGFKDIKRGFFHWEQSKMTCPHRAERLWLVLSIALLWLTARGEKAFDDPRWSSLRATPSQARRLSAPVLGWITGLIALFKQAPAPPGYLNPYVWHSLAEP
jgi:hypothetical protein